VYSTLSVIAAGWATILGAIHAWKPERQPIARRKRTGV